MSKKKRDCILLLGVTVESTGIGGVTIHTSRLCQWLSKRGYPYDFCDYKHTSIWTQVKEISRHPLVHIHANNPKATLFWVLVGKITGTKTILTIHGEVGYYSNWNHFAQLLSIKFCNTPILLNMKSYQIASKWNSNSRLISAFIPPVSDGDLSDIYEHKIASERQSGKTIVATNAYSRVFNEDGKEIYGIDFLVNYFKDKEEYLLCVSDPSGKYSKEYEDKQYGNILFITGSHSFFRVLKSADIMIRGTVSDGDSLSVREALMLGREVIATDCVDRPAGVVLFKYNDEASLAKALVTGTQSLDNEYEDVVETLRQLYDNLLK